MDSERTPRFLIKEESLLALPGPTLNTFVHGVWLRAEESFLIAKGHELLLLANAFLLQLAKAVQPSAQ